MLIRAGSGSGGGGSLDSQVVQVTGTNVDGGNHNLSTPTGITVKSDNFITVFAVDPTYMYSVYATIDKGTLANKYSNNATISIVNTDKINLKWQNNSGSVARIYVSETKVGS